MLKRLACVIALVAFASAGTVAKAAIIAIGESGFSGGESIIDFEGQGFSHGDAITNQYAGLGVQFSGDFSADLVNKFLLPPSSDSVAAGNTSSYPFGSAVIDFTFRQNRLGFDVVTASSDDMRLELQVADGLGGFTTTGTIDFATQIYPSTFVGAEDLVDGFDRVILSAIGGAFGAFALDNLRFESTGTSDSVPLSAHMPVPAALPLMASALAGLGFFGWRRKRRSAA